MSGRSDQRPWRFSPEPFPRAPSLTGGRFDRADNMRGRPERIAEFAARPDARALVLWSGRPLVASEDGPASLAWRAIDDRLTQASDEPPIFLGLDPENGDAPRFAVDLSHLEEEAVALDATAADDSAVFAELRGIVGGFAAWEAAAVAEAKSLTDWRRTHQFCARCGAPTAQASAGWRRECPACGASHFPRTDPVVIMLVVHRAADGAERLALGRQKTWPPGLHSLLAGYIEPGESVEEAVRRETFEEAGVPVGRVAYLTSQPWPFPSTLMIGCWAEALSDVLSPDYEELEACLWVTRDEMRRALDGEHAYMKPPRADAIARTLTQAWVDGAFDEGTEST